MARSTGIQKLKSSLRETLEQVKAARPTIDYDLRYGADSGEWTTAMFVEAIYNEMKAAK